MLEGYADATVLIVDDQVANVVLLQQMLEAEGMTRVSAVTDPRNVFRDLYAKTCRAAMGLPGG